LVFCRFATDETGPYDGSGFLACGHKRLLRPTRGAAVAMISPCFDSIGFYFCDARFSRLPALSPLALRFIAAIISTSPSVKPRVVILHITASQLTRSIASLLKARAVPNVVAHVTAGKERGFAEFRSAGKCRKPKLSILSFGGLAETVAGRNICNIRPA
jgi:hypothetical protein